MTDDAARPYHHGDLARALLRQALETVAQGGAAELSLRAVARAAGVAPAAVYRHFADRRALLSACAADGVDSVVLGGGPLAGLAGDLAADCPVPLIDGTSSAVGQMRERLRARAPVATFAARQD